MLDRDVVQQFYDNIVKRKATEAERDRIALSLLDAYPELAHIRFRDYEVGTPWRTDSALHMATAYGMLDLVRKLISLGADVNAQKETGKTPLAIALPIGSDSFEMKFAMMESLLKSGADPNLPENSGITVLHSSTAVTKAATIVPLLLRYGADPNRRTKEGAVPLHFWGRSASIGEVESYMQVLHILIAHGADIHAVDDMGNTLLMSAIEHNCDAVEAMIGYGADVHAKTKRGWTAIHAAAMAYDEKQAEEIVLLLKAGASCHVKDKRGYTPLHVAAALCGMEAARLLLEAGADVNARNYRGVTPLTLVEARKNPFMDSHPDEETYERMVALLRMHGATYMPGIHKKEDVVLYVEPIMKKTSKVDENVGREHEERRQEQIQAEREVEIWRDNPLLDALFQLFHKITQGDEEGQQTLQDLLTAHPELIKARRRFIGMPLHYAANRLHPGLVRMCVAFGADVHVRNDYGATPLTVAFEGADPVFEEGRHHSEVVEILLNAGADPNRGNIGALPLNRVQYYASSPVFVPLLQLLLNAGADPNLQDKHGWSPMHSLCKFPAVLPLLAEYGGNVNIATKEGNTPLTLWISSESAPALRTLLTLGAKVDHRDKRGLCALHYAAAVVPSGEVAVKVLLVGGADPTLKDRRGYTPLHFAAGSCARESIQLLLAAGADINAVSKRGETPLAIVESREHLVAFTEPPSAEEYAETATLLRQAGVRK